jgi:hypothetical protein
VLPLLLHLVLFGDMRWLMLFFLWKVDGDRVLLGWQETDPRQDRD